MPTRSAVRGGASPAPTATPQVDERVPSWGGDGGPVAQCFVWAAQKMGDPSGCAAVRAYFQAQRGAMAGAATFAHFEALMQLIMDDALGEDDVCAWAQVVEAAALGEIARAYAVASMVAPTERLFDSVQAASALGRALLRVRGAPHQ